MTSSPYLIGEINGSSGTTNTITPAVATTAGDTIVVVPSVSTSGTITSVADSAGNTYAQQASNTSENPTYVWVSPGPAGGPGAGPTAALTTSSTITVTWASPSGTRIAAAVGCSGLLAIDQNPATTSAGSGTAASITSAALNGTPEACVAVVVNGSGGGGAGTWASPWTTLLAPTQAGSGGQYMSLASQVVTPTTAVTASFTLGASGKWCMALLTFYYQIVISPASLPGGNTGVLYSEGLSATGGTNSYTWSVVAGALPPGLGLSGATISGVPSAVGFYSFTVEATDGVGHTATLPLSITITPSVIIVGNWEATTTVPGGVPGNPVQPPATQSLQVTGITNSGAAGNWLIAICGWRSPATALTTVAVGDDQHQPWEPLGAPNGTTPLNGDTSVSVWALPNARKIGNLFVSPTGPVQAICCILIEVSGLSAWNTLAGVVTGYAPSGSAVPTLSLPAPASQALYLTVSGVDLETATTSIPSGWAPVTTLRVTNGTDTTGDFVLAAGYQAGTVAGPSASWSVSPAADQAVLIVGVLVNGTVPTAPNPQWPLVSYQAGFGAGAATPWDQIAWTDITPRYLGMSGNRGKQYELDVIQAGQTNFTLRNNDAALTPGTSVSAYYAGTSAWRVTTGAGTFAPAPQPSYSFLGMAAGLYTPDGVTANGHAESTGSPVIPTSTYTATAWVLCPAGWSPGGQTDINWYASGGGYLSTTNGATVVLPAGQWTYLSVSGPAPAGAATGTIVVQPNGTPPITTRFWVASARFLSPAGTTLNNWSFGLGPQVYTPERLVMTWPPPPAVNATRQVVQRGFMERWPQALDNARYQLANASGTDAWALLTPLMLTLPREEMLADAPYGLWSCDDPAVSATASSLSGTTANPLQVVQSKYGAGTAIQGFGGTGGLPGDPGGTVWTQSGAPANGTQGFCLSCQDPNLPPLAGGVTIEGWFALSATQAIAFPGIIVVRNPKGPVVKLGVENPSGNIGLLVYDKITGAGSLTTISTANWMTAAPFYLRLSLTPTTWTVTVISSTGLSTAVTMSGTCNLATSPYWFMFLGWADMAGAGGFTNATAELLAVYPSLLPAGRLTTHYLAGVTGISAGDSNSTTTGGDYPGNRMERLLGDSTCAYPRCIPVPGYPPTTTGINQSGYQLVGALDISGQAASQNVTNVAESDAGFLMIDGPGYIYYQSRRNGYNLPVSWVFGEQVAQPLNQNSTFEQGILPWGAFPGGAAVQQSSTWSYRGLYSMLLTTNGTLATPAAVAEFPGDPVTPGVSYTASAWLFTPQGCVAQISIFWYSSSSILVSSISSSAMLTPGAPEQIAVTGRCPNGAAYAQMIVEMTGTPPATTGLYIDQAILATTYTEYPYLPDFATDFDPSQVFNDLTLSQLSAPATIGATASGVTITLASAASIATYGDQTLQETIYTAAAQGIIDLANWIINTMGTPQLRIAIMTLDPAANPALWPVVLGLELGQVIQVNRRLSGTEVPPEITGQFEVMSLAHSNQPGVWKTQVAAVPYFGNVLTCDDVVRGVLAGGPSGPRLGW